MKFREAVANVPECARPRVHQGWMVPSAIHVIARACSLDGTFPLSPREREPRLPTLDGSPRVLHANARTAFSPLPKGEGRGEGEETLPHSAAHSSHDRSRNFQFPILNSQFPA